LIGFFDAFGQNETINRPFGLAYSKNLRGGVYNFGNTSMHLIDNDTVHLSAMNETGDPENLQGGVGYSQYGNDYSDVRQLDIDEESVTINSSSADLILPAGSNTIKFARLYWSGRMPRDIVDNLPDTLRKIKIRKGISGNYISLSATEVLKDLNDEQNFYTYQSYVDITNYIQVQGAGTYTVADIPLSESFIFGGQYGGWAISVVYENSALAFHSIRIYDGFATVYNGGVAGSLGFTLSGLNVPGVAISPEDAVMGVIAWEGDANLPGDYVKINGNIVSNYTNPANNFFNGSMTRNGSYVSEKNPNYFNQIGVDIDELYVGVGYGIEPNAKNVDVILGTERDKYFPGIFTFSIRVKDPTLVIEKKVDDNNHNTYVDPSEELTYTISGGNIGKGNSYNTFFTDTLPPNVTYVPNSFEVLTVPGEAVGIKTDFPG
jgi:uncharacterized repeat protein (TIGR01451 family)